MNAFTTMSGKGQVVIPRGVRERLRMAPGDRLEVVERPDGVLLRREAPVAPADFDAVTARIRSRVRYAGPALSVEEMDEAVAGMWAAGSPGWDR